MKRRVFPYGFGKIFLEINVNELPEDIQKQFKEIYNGRFKNHEHIMICGEIHNLDDTNSSK